MRSTVWETLDELKKKARKEEDLRRALLSTRQSEDALADFCRISTEQGLPLSPMEMVSFGEEAYAEIRRSTNGGGENSPLLEWSDDCYELFLADLE